MKEDCIFCKLAAGVIPTNSIYEDEDFRVILDADPATKGHALIIPKAHYDNLLDAENECISKILPLAKRVAKKQMEAYGCPGVNIVQNNGEVAGQTVFHLHVHVIPRYENKDAILTWTHESFSGEEFSEITQTLQLD